MKHAISGNILSLGIATVLGGLAPAVRAQPVCPTNYRTTNVPLTTDRLRYAAPILGVGVGKTGVQFSRDVGRSFQEYVQFNYPPQHYENTKPYASGVRADNTAGYRNGPIINVIPDIVRSAVIHTLYGDLYYPESVFYEMKAVKGTLYLSSSQWQIDGLIDIAAVSPGTKDGWNMPIYFVTTGNTTINSSVLRSGQCSGCRDFSRHSL